MQQPVQDNPNPPHIDRLLRQTAAQSPFRLQQLAGKQTFIHQIELDAYQRFRQSTDPTFFFRDLSDAFRDAGCLIIHLWEDVRLQKPEVVASRLRALAGESVRVPARLTQVRRIDRPTTLAFLEQHHLQVAVASKYKYGLWLPRRYYRVLPSQYLSPEQAAQPECLVAVATFSHPRVISRDGQPFRSFELVRFANRVGCTVVGGLNKLLQAFIHDQHPDDLMTYADRDWSDGRSYEQLGFERVGQTEPQLFWLDPLTLIRHYPHRTADTSGLIPIWNAGSIKFVKKIRIPTLD